MEILGKINEIAYRLKLLEHVKLYLVFHVSLLKDLSSINKVLPTYVDVQEVQKENHDLIGTLDKKEGKLRNRELVF